MVTKCGDGCHVICDFCHYFTEYVEKDSDTGDAVSSTGDGFCHFKQKVVDLTSGCDEYICSRIEPKIIKRQLVRMVYEE